MPLGDPRFGQIQPCACLEARRAERRAERQAADAAAQLAALRNELGSLGDKTFENFNPDWPSDPRQRESLRRALRQAQQYAAAPGDAWLYLGGSTGNGKSHLAAAAAMQIAQAQQSAGYYRSTVAMLRNLREGYQDGTFDDRVVAVCSVPILVLDDLGTEPNTEQNRALLFEIINHRVGRPDLLTLITSNVPLAESADRRIASRLTMRCVELRIVAGDYRVAFGRARAAPGGGT